MLVNMMAYNGRIGTTSFIWHHLHPFLAFLYVTFSNILNKNFDFIPIWNLQSKDCFSKLTHIFPYVQTYHNSSMYYTIFLRSPSLGFFTQWTHFKVICFKFNREIFGILYFIAGLIPHLRLFLKQVYFEKSFRRTLSICCAYNQILCDKLFI